MDRWFLRLGISINEAAGAKLKSLTTESGCGRAGQDLMDHFSQLHHRASKKVQGKSDGRSMVSWIQQRDCENGGIPHIIHHSREGNLIPVRRLFELRDLLHSISDH
jgi:hypothetical protein